MDAGRRDGQLASAARRARRRARSIPARAATAARAASPTTTCTASRRSTRTGSRCSRTTSTGTTGRCATRSTTGARSCRAGCTRRASPARTATIRTRSSCGRPANAVCAQCHQPAKFDTPAHTHHAAGTPGAACAACHMPTTTYMVVDRAPRSLAAHSAARSIGEARHAERVQQLPREADARSGPPTPSASGTANPGRLPEFRRGAARGIDRQRPARGSAALTLIEDKSQPAIVRASAIARLGPPAHAGDDGYRSCAS